MTLNSATLALLAVALARVTSSQEPPPVPEHFDSPDGAPPSLETVCDLKPEPARHLCVAYCEELECDRPDIYASRTDSRGCLTLSSRYQEWFGEALPCESDCPCIDVLESFASIADRWVTYSGSICDTAVCSDESCGKDFLALAVRAEDLLAYVWTDCEGPSCQPTGSMPYSACWDGVGPRVPVNYPEALACMAILDEVITAADAQCRGRDFRSP